MKRGLAYRLDGDWILTADHAASRYGVPVLMQISTGASYGPFDVVPDVDLIAGEYVSIMADGAPDCVQGAVSEFLRPWVAGSGRKAV